MRGRSNSSITRIRPVFSALLERDATGATWLPKLLHLAPNAEHIARPLREAPGLLKATSTTDRPYSDPILGRIQLAGCFEREFPPPERFLRWLIEHPERLTWPANPGTGHETLRRRRALVGAVPAERDDAEGVALAQLDRLGASGSRRKWWAFEGFTQVDCCLETEHMMLLVEGKRNEPIAAATAWFPARNQLVRNIEIAAEVTTRKPAFVLLATEHPAPEPTPTVIAASTPHLNPAERNRLVKCYLGQVSWRAIVDELDLPDEVLPDERT